MSWLGIIRLGLIQAALGSLVVVVTSTLNRVMVVEYALPAMLPGALVALHYGVQLIRPRFGHASDRGGKRTPWVSGGMGTLACGSLCCAWAAPLIVARPWLGIAGCVVGYTLVGLGVGAAGTSLLVLMAQQVEAARRAAAAMIMWILMIAGFAATSLCLSRMLDPFSPERLFDATLAVACSALVLTLFGIWRSETAPLARATLPSARVPAASFATALRAVWAEQSARRFTLFILLSMLAYSAQELLLEPFAGLVFGSTLGESARLAGQWHAAALIGMIGVGIAGSGRRAWGSPARWTQIGCAGSALALVSLAVVGASGSAWALRPSVLVLGVANGMFAVAAVASMMSAAHGAAGANVGVRMGMWGGAQAVAFAVGGFLATSVVDVARGLSASPVVAFVIVFVLEAALFFAALRFARPLAAGGPAFDPNSSTLSEA